jgi:predicted AlkP superfamily phosphohydrolase/phosphomutase
MSMKKLKVFGLDGMSYFEIKKNFDVLPNWKKIEERYPLTLLWADVEDRKRPWKYDSAMLWTTIFTGKRPEDHQVWGYKEGIDGRPLKREDVKARFIWEYEGAKFLVWHVPAVLPPLHYRCEGVVPTDRTVPDLDEWCSYVGKLLQSGIEYDVFIAVYTGSDDFQHHHWGKDDFFDFYDRVARCLLRHLREEDDVLIISDHGFTDIDTAVSHMWTWRYSKTVNLDIGHHAPWGICATNLRWRPFKVSEVCEAIVRNLILKGAPIRYAF